MENSPQTIYIAIGSIIAALITGYFSFVNELRKEISKFSSQAIILSLKISIFQGEEEKTAEDFLNDHREEQSEFFECWHLIHLREDTEKIQGHICRGV